MNDTTKRIAKNILTIVGVDKKKFHEKLCKWSISRAVSERGYGTLIATLRAVQPDLSEQYSAGKELYNEYTELKLRGMHAFQCSMMLRLLEYFPQGPITVADIGDSAGTHMRYLRELARGNHDVDTISINLDPRAIEKIRARGQKALLCRAEELDLEENRAIDAFTSFEMVEHLHNPALFFRRLAKKSSCNRMLITVPYLRTSRVGLYNVRNRSEKNIFAEDEHVFELCPEDWTLLMYHSGWKIIYSDIYYQYPTRFPVISPLLSCFWRARDFEGFWGAILIKDTTFADRYLDWED